MRETILLMGGDEGLTAAVRRALAPLKILVRTVPPERYGDSLGYLAGDRSCPQADAPGEALVAPLLVLAGLDGGRPWSGRGCALTTRPCSPPSTGSGTCPPSTRRSSGSMNR